MVDSESDVIDERLVEPESCAVEIGTVGDDNDKVGMERLVDADKSCVVGSDTVSDDKGKVGMDRVGEVNESCIVDSETVVDNADGDRV